MQIYRGKSVDVYYILSNIYHFVDSSKCHCRIPLLQVHGEQDYQINNSNRSSAACMSSTYYYGVTSTTDTLQLLMYFINRHHVVEATFVSANTLEHVYISNKWDEWMCMIVPIIHKHIGGRMAIRPIFRKPANLSKADVLLSCISK